MTTWLGTGHTPTSQILVGIALGVGLALGGFWTFFICAEILSDPGGWQGVVWTCAVLVPMLLLSALAWWFPRTAMFVLGVLAGLFVLGNIITMFFGAAWAGFEETHGPIGMVASLALSVPCVVLGRSRPLIAATYLLAMTLVLLVSAFAEFFGVRGMVGLAVLTVNVPFIGVAVLLLSAGLLDRRERSVVQ